MTPGETTGTPSPTVEELQEQIRRLAAEKHELAHEAEWWEIQHGRALSWRMYALWAMAMLLMTVSPSVGTIAFLAAIWYCWDDAVTAGEATARTTYPWVRRGQI